MAKCCVVSPQSPFEDLTAFRIRHVLLLVSILTSDTPIHWADGCLTALQDVVKSRSREKTSLDFSNRPELHGHLGSSAAEMPARFQDGTMIITSNVAVSKLHKVWW